MKQRTGTFRCWLWGHKFYGRKMVYEPHYLKAVELGFVNTLCDKDYHISGEPKNYCIRCGVDKLPISHQ